MSRRRKDIDRCIPASRFQSLLDVFPIEVSIAESTICLDIDIASVRTIICYGNLATDIKLRKNSFIRAAKVLFPDCLIGITPGKRSSSRCISDFIIEHTPRGNSRITV